MRLAVALFVLVLSVAGSSLGDSGPADHSKLQALAAIATSANSSESTSAIELLRAAGPAGLDLLIEKYASEVTAMRRGLASKSEYGDHWKRIATALDGVSAQRDSYASGLYWHTDLEKAKAASAASGKPIMSLRLLGRLDEDLSCANSRYFRLTLYSNPAISQFMRDHFVLHWQSVRSVPKITIDFGDGRKLERTLTGNSIHYMLNSSGYPIDALPGLYGARPFLRWLRNVHQAAAVIDTASTETERDNLIRTYHQARIRELDSEWKADLIRAGISRPPMRAFSSEGAQGNKPPTAIEASKRAMTKALVAENPILRRISLDRKDPLLPAADDQNWARIGGLYGEDARLDAASLSLISQKNSRFESDRNGFQNAVRNLEAAIAGDTARNKYILETILHQWFIAGEMPKDLTALNERVYSDLFLTPSSDPWLGLFPANSYIGIENEGVLR